MKTIYENKQKIDKLTQELFDLASILVDDGETETAEWYQPGEAFDMSVALLQISVDLAHLIEEALYLTGKGTPDKNPALRSKIKRLAGQLAAANAIAEVEVEGGVG